MRLTVNELVQNKIVKKDDGWYVYSEDGKNLGGPYDSEEEAKKRLQQVEAFKHMNKNQLQSLTFNLRPHVRKDTMEGREYLVVPMVMLTEGVHAGSNGPLLYTAEDLGKTPVVWNHKPVVVYHPTMNGQPVSACDPVIISNRKIGVIMNTRFEQGKLKAEAWLEESRIRAVDDRVLDAIEKGQMVEVSTGLFTDNEEVEGEWNGEKYIAIARNHRPDHLAILPDQKGACSIADGAGLLRNQSTGDVALAQLVLHKAQEILNKDLSYADIQKALTEKINHGQQGTPGALPQSESYVVDVFKTYFVYEHQGKLFWQNYTRKNGDIELVGTAEEVTRETRYIPVKNVQKETQNKEKTMDKERLVTDLIVNKQTAWSEADRDLLMGMDENVLAKMIPIANETSASDGLADAEKEKKVSSAEDKKEEPETVETYVAKAPEGIREVLMAGLQAHQAQKNELIAAITSNKANTFTKEDLEAMSLKQLRGIASLARVETKKDPLYVGAGDPVATTNVEEPLIAPVLNFEKEE